MDINDKQGRRGSGRSMATMLAAQLWAVDCKVVLFVYGCRGERTPGQLTKWLHSLHPSVLKNLKVYSARTLQEVADQLIGLRPDKVFVDHHIIERAEDELERRIQALRNEHERLAQDKETIR